MKGREKRTRFFFFCHTVQVLEHPVVCLNCSMREEARKPSGPNLSLSQDSRIPPDTIKTEGPCLSRGHTSHGGSWALARPVFSLQGVWVHRQIRDFMSQCQRQMPPGSARKQLSLLKQLELNIARECATSVLFLKSSGTKTQIHSYIKKKKKNAWGFSQKSDSGVKRVNLKCTWIHS